MPNTIDERIVEMQFDNKNFEKNIKQSLNSLEQLDKALEMKDATKGFENLERAANSIDLSKLERAADVIEKRFSTAGIAGAALINKAVNGLVDGVVGLGKKVVNLAKTGGISRAMKLEHAQFMLTGLLKDANAAAAIVSGPVNNAVKGTAYGLDAAANAAAQLAASGVTDMQEMEKVLKGIAGVASMTGSEFEDISQIFTTVAGQGKVMTRQLRQIEARGLNAAATIAKSLDTTESAVREMVKDGEISFKIFSDAMADAFGEQAKKANETFEGALKNVRAALSRIGAKVATPSLEAMRWLLVECIDFVDKLNIKLSSGIIPEINKIIDRISVFAYELLHDARSMEFVEGVLTNILKIFHLFSDLLDPLSMAMKDVFPGSLIDNLIAFNDGFGKLLDKLKLTEQQSTYLAHIFRGILDILDLALMAIEGIFNISLPGLGKLFDATDSLSTKLLKIGAFIGVLIDRFHDFVKSGEFVSSVLSKLGGLFGFVGSHIPSILSILKTAIIVIGGILYVIGNAIYEIGLAVKNTINYLKKLKPVQDALAVTKDALEWVGDKLLKVANALGIAIGYIVTQIHRLAQGDVAGVFEDLKNAIDPLGVLFDKATAAVLSFFDVFKKNKQVTDGIEKVTKKFDNNMAYAVNAPGARNFVLTRDQGVKEITAQENLLKTAEKNFADAATGIKSKMEDLITVGNLFSLAFGAAIVVTLVNVAKAIGRVSRMFRSFGRIGDSISYFLQSLAVGVNAFALTQVAVAIGAIATSIFLLTKFCEPQKVLASAGAIAALMAAMVGIVALMKFDIFKTAVGRFQVAASGFIAFAGSIVLLIFALRKIYDIAGDTGRLLKAVFGLVAVIAAMGGIVALMGSIHGRFAVSWKGALALIEIATAMYAMAVTLEKLGSVDLEKAYKALPLITAILAEFAVIMVASTVVFSPVAGLGAMGMAAAILIFMKGLGQIAEINPKVLDQALQIVNAIGNWIRDVAIVLGIALTFRAAFEAAEAGFTWLSAKLQGITSGWKSMFVGLNKGLKHLGDGAAIALMVTGVAASILLIANAIIALGKLKPEELEQGVEVCAAIGLAVVGLVTWITRMGVELANRVHAKETIVETMVSISALLLSLAASIKVISTIPETDVWRSVGVVATMSALMVGIMALLSVINRKIGPMISVSIATIGALSLFLLTMSASLALLSLIAKDNDSYGAALAGLFVVSVGMMLILVGLGQMAPFTVAATVSVGLISVLLLSMAAMFKIMDGIDTEKAQTNVDNMFKVLATISVVVGAIAILQYLSAGTAAVAIAAAEAVVEGLVLILASLAGVGILLSQINAEGLKATFQTIADAVDIFTDAIAKLGARLMSEEYQAIIAGGTGLYFFAQILEVLALAAVGFGAAAVLFGEAAYLFGNGIKALAEGIKTLQNVDVTVISNQIGRFAESCKGINQNAPGLFLSAAALGSFGVGLGVFSLAAMLAVEAVEKFAKADLSGLAGNLTEVANAVHEFANALGLLGAGILAGIIVALGALGLVLLPLAGGILAVALAVGVFGGAVYILVGGLNSVVELITTVTEYFAKMGENLDKAAQAIQNLGRTSVQDIYAALIQNADMLKDAGAVLVQKVADGFKEGIDESFNPAITDAANYVVTGFTNAIDAQKQKSYQSGVNFAKGFLDGLTGNAGLDENSPSKKTEKAGVYAGEGFTNAVSAQSILSILSSAGANWAVELLNGLSDKLSALFPGIMDQVSQMVNSIAAMFDSVGAEVEDKYGIKNTWYGSKRMYNQLKSGTLEYHGPGGDYGVKSGRRVESTIQSRANNTASIYNSIKAINAESEALGGNSKAAGKNSKAKEENEEANDGKTEAIDEETESLGEEEQATNDNEEALRAMAEEIEVVTEKYKELNAWTGWVNKFKFTNKMFNTMGQAWSKAFKDIKRASDGTEEVIKHNYHEISGYFNDARDTIPKTTAKIAKGLYAFDETSGKMEKKYTKRLKKVSGSLKSITKQVQKSGKMIAKVYEGYAKVYTKAGNGKVDKMVVRLTKNVKNLGKWVKSAKDFVNSFNDDVKGAQYVEDFTENLRKIENFFVKRQNMPKKVQDYLGNILSYFNKDFKQSMNLMAKQIDGIGDYWKKGTQSTAYVADAYTQLAATLYDGSEAANQYWTEIARMQFLVENGLEPPEKLEELYVGYLERAVEALKEYKAQLDETIAGQFNPFEQFDEKMEDQTKNLLDCLESQIIGFERWGEGLQALSSRGADFNLIKDLADQGVESYGIMKNLLSMTASELALYNKYYRMIDTVKQKASDSALAAVANARTNANLRAAAKSGKLSQKQMEKQRNIAKRMSDDIKSVAHAEVYYNQMSKKQEKEYLKTLTKRERKEYKKQKKALKAAKAEEERLAAEEAARRAEEKRIQTIMDSIKNYESLINVINQYCNDAAVMARVNEKLDATLSGVYKNLGKSTRVTKAWLAFGKQLGAEDGEDAESFFSNLQSVISSFRDGIKDALYDIKEAFTEFTKSSEKVDMAKLFANNISQVRASTLFGQYIMQLANMGYNSQVIEYIGKQFSSDRASALEMMTQMIAATKQEITNMNNGISSLKNAMEKSMKLVDESVIRAQEDPEQAAFNQAQAAYQKAMKEWEKFTKEDNFSIFNPKISHEHHELEEMLNRARDLNAELNKVTGTANKANVRGQMYDEYKSQVKQILKMTDLTTKQKVTAARELGKAYNITITSLKEYDRKIEDIRFQLANLQNSGQANSKISREYEDLKRQLDKMISERENSIAYQLDLLEKQYEAEKQAAEAAKNNAEAAYQEALNTWNAIKTERERLQSEYELQTAFENALITITMGIEKWDDLTALMKANGWTADWLQRTYRKINSALAPVNKAITLAKKNFSGWNGKSKSVLSELGTIEEGFLRLASTLEATNDETGAFIDDLGTRLEEYRKTLYDTIKGQVSLFDEFKKFSGEKATTANKYLDNMQSQINGVKEWLTNLEKLATMGVSGDVLKMFAEEGQGSFEKVAAFANATEEQIGELNAQYAEYMRLTEEAADRALATVGAAFSDGAIKMQDEMIAKFKASGAKRIADAAYEAGIMVVTGVKDGINAASPQIVYEIQGATQTINETLSKTLTSSAIEESIRKGLNTMSGALQNSVGVMVSDFLTGVTNTSVQKFKMAVDSCRAYVEATLPTDWTITIHVDTSEIDAAVARMNEAVAMTNFNAGQTSNTVTSSLANQQQAQVIGSQQPAAPNQTTVNYTQNNYSPKTLSRAEIYRQTQNQLSTITGVVNSANG